MGGLFEVEVGSKRLGAREKMKGSTVSVAALKPVGLEYETIFDSSRYWRTCAGCGRADAIRINLASASRLNNFG